MKLIKKWIKNKLRDEILDEYFRELISERYKKSKLIRLYLDDFGNYYDIKLIKKK